MDDTLYKEIIHSIQAVFELTARVDERVKLLMDKQTQIDAKLESLSVSQMNLSTKVSVLETKDGKELRNALVSLDNEVKEATKEIHAIDMRLHGVEQVATRTENKWQMVFDFVYKTVWVVLVCYLLFKLNLQPPPLP